MQRNFQVAGSRRSAVPAEPETLNVEGEAWHVKRFRVAPPPSRLYSQVVFAKNPTRLTAE